MKTIIACTDFSTNANNAVQYAAALTKATNARLLLFHYFNYPIPATDLQAVFPTTFVGQGTAEAEKALITLKESIVRTYQIDVDFVVRTFDLPIDLEGVFHEEKATLVVMGTQGHSAVVNAFFGNVTSGVIRRGKLPVLLIPSGAMFHPVKKILFPCDNHEIARKEIIQPMLDLAHSFDAYTEVLTLFDLEKTPALAPKGNVSAVKSNLETLLASTRHGYAFENEDAVDKGILYEAVRSGADMVAMIPHHHSFISSLLNKSETQRVAATISIPLLVLGEN